jgi:hypothetical protein
MSLAQHDQYLSISRIRSDPEKMQNVESSKSNNDLPDARKLFQSFFGVTPDPRLGVEVVRFPRLRKESEELTPIPHAI